MADPAASIYEREPCRDLPAPVENTIAIDPALGGTPIEPHPVSEQPFVAQQPVNDEPELTQPPASAQYSDAPQGEPYGQHPLNSYFVDVQIQPEPPTTHKLKRKRSRKVCDKCQGSKQRDEKTGQQEVMLTCIDCSMNGHPSCLAIPVSDPTILKDYGWKCSDCKTCEICNEKTDEAHMLFCDRCDRGWHQYCLNPPLESPPAPTDRWFCPRCTVQDPNLLASLVGGGKGKGRAVVISSDSSSSSGSDDDMDVNESPVAHRSKASPQRAESSKSPKKKKKTTKRPRAGSTTDHLRIKLSRSSNRAQEIQNLESPGMFDDILDETQRDTSKSTITENDKKRFETSASSTVPAEPKLAHAGAPTPGRDSEQPDAGPSSRPLRSSTMHHVHAPPAASQSPAPSTPGPYTTVPPGTKLPLRIRSIRFGPYDIKTWYDAPFPEEYANIPDGKLWLCEFCLKYMKSSFDADRHRMKCKCKHPPGDEIYRDGFVSVFEVDGRKNKIYCQNLCLLSKMFLDHKSLFYDVEPFLFYVMTEVDESGARFLGYFSKEKRSPKDYNVSCIMTLPVRQRQGWGNLLIDFSYLLSKKEQRLGSPEKPLSGLGALGYKNYWTLAVMRFLEHAPDNPRLEDICAATSMTLEDVHSTLVHQNMITIRDTTPPPIRPSPGQTIKYPKGRRNGVAGRHLQKAQTKDKMAVGPFMPPAEYQINWDREQVSQYLRKWEAKGYMIIQPEKLKWSPFLMARSQALSDSTLMPGSNGTAEKGTPSRTISSDGVDRSKQNSEKYPPDILQDVPSEEELPLGTAEKRAARLRRDQLLAEEATPTRRTSQTQDVFTTPGRRRVRSKKAGDDEPLVRGGKAGKIASPSKSRRVDFPPELKDESRHGMTDEQTNGLNGRHEPEDLRHTPNPEGFKSDGSGTPLNSRHSVPSDDSTLVAVNALLGFKDGDISGARLQSVGSELQMNGVDIEMEEDM